MIIKDTPPRLLRRSKSTNSSLIADSTSSNSSYHSISSLLVRPVLNSACNATIIIDKTEKQQSSTPPSMFPVIKQWSRREEN